MPDTVGFTSDYPPAQVSVGGAAAQIFPVATYRLQMHAGFGFDKAAEIASHVAELGISHVYLPPIFAANPGSRHGYDVADHSRINPELGGRAGYDHFTAVARSEGLKQIVDIVPNHMSTGGTWWQDVLAKGKDSPHAASFDIDWNPPQPELKGKVLVPKLGDRYETILARGEIKIEERNGDLRVAYWENDWPMTAQSKAAVRAEMANDSKALEKINADPARVDALVRQQHYVLADYHEGPTKLNYRPFFDIDGLPALKVERPDVFAATHELILGMVRDRSVDGVRIDHPDGLRNPGQYLDNIEDRAPGLWKVVEKITEPGERLKPEWKADGTTGYDFMHQVGQLLIDPRNEATLTGIYKRFTGQDKDYETLCHDNKLMVMGSDKPDPSYRNVLSGQVSRVSRALDTALAATPATAGFSPGETREALTEVIANFPVYRTYVQPADGTVSAADRVQIDHALTGARAHRPDIDPKLIDAIGDMLLLKNKGEAQSEFVERFQQITGPVMAKAVEDTTYYQYNRFLAKNEVGGNPAPRTDNAPPATLVQQFHEYCLDVHETKPRQMNSTSTHDTKRSEDVRARLSVLSEMPEAWEKAVTEWARHDETLFRKAGDPGAPIGANGKPEPVGTDRNTQYAIYQTLVGAWPIEEDRMQAYVGKAIKEAKTHTSWINADPEYEAGTRNFVSALYKDPGFAARMDAFVQPIVEAGYRNSLTQTLLKATSPGIPDYYQGSERWHFCNVDPDNRQPVDFDSARAVADRLRFGDVGKRLELEPSGAAKEWQTAVVLAVRQQYREAFSDRGSYAPLYASGPNAGHIVAQMRGDKEGPAVVSVAPILTQSMAPGDTATTLPLPEGTWRNRLTGDTFEGGMDVKVADLLQSFPTAILAREDHPAATPASARPLDRLLGMMNVTPPVRPAPPEEPAPGATIAEILPRARPRLDTVEATA